MIKVSATLEQQQIISYARATATPGMTIGCPEIRYLVYFVLNYRQKQRGISYATAAKDTIGQQLSYEWQECSLSIPINIYTSQLEMILVAF